jgi:hypothetical protein
MNLSRFILNVAASSQPRACERVSLLRDGLPPVAFPRDQLHRLRHQAWCNVLERATERRLLQPSLWQAAVLLARWWLPEPIMHRLIMRLEAKREALSSPVRRQPLHSPNNTNGIRHGWLSLNCRNANKRARAYSGVGRAARTGIVPCVVFSVITTKLPAEGQTLTEPGGAGAGCPGQCSISSRTNLYGRSCSPASCSGSKEWLLKDDLCDDPGTTSSPPSPGLTSSR